MITAYYYNEKLLSYAGDSTDPIKANPAFLQFRFCEGRIYGQLSCKMGINDERNVALNMARIFEIAQQQVEDIFARRGNDVLRSGFMQVSDAFGKYR